MSRDDNPHSKPPDLPQYRGDAECVRYLQIGQFVRQQRKGLGWSQTKLAKRAGVDQKTISNIENATYHASEEVIGFVLQAMKLLPDAVDSLPNTDFHVGSAGFLLKVVILRGILDNMIPIVESGCLKESLARWQNDLYLNAKTSEALEDAVLASLTAEGYLQIDEAGHYIVQEPLDGRVYGFLSNYVSMIMRATYWSCLKQEGAPQIKMAQINRDLKNIESSLLAPEKLLRAVDAFHITLADGDRLLACELFGLSNGLRFIVEMTTALFNDLDGYKNAIVPLFEFLIGVTRRVTDVEAYDECVSDRKLASMSEACAPDLEEFLTGWLPAIAESVTPKTNVDEH